MKDQIRESKPGRRQHDRAFKEDLIAQSLVPGTSVAAIAMKGGINANLLFKWRREHARERAQAIQQTATLLPVCVIPDVAPTAPADPAASVGDGTAAGKSNARPSVIEIEIAAAQVRLRGPVDEVMLGRVLRALRQSA